MLRDRTFVNHQFKTIHYQKLYDKLLQRWLELEKLPHHVEKVRDKWAKWATESTMTLKEVDPLDVADNDMMDLDLD
jgi:hypothetical protein